MEEVLEGLEAFFTDPKESTLMEEVRANLEKERGSHRYGPSAGHAELELPQWKSCGCRGIEIRNGSQNQDDFGVPATEILYILVVNVLYVVLRIMPAGGTRNEKAMQAMWL